MSITKKVMTNLFCHRGYSIKPNLPGINDEGILTLRTVEDTLRIRDIVSSEDIKSAVIIGGGFIGVEVAENLKNRD